ncbi:MAG: hypothetical protein N4A74_21455 [Carboxylicivirga sp.]|jgi:hypothetical protein|nr:hypothetical protein [Carboxylicivirga sp.]
MNARDEKYLKAYPRQDTFYFTSDGLAFFNKGDAQGHARTIKGDQNLRELIRPIKKQDKKQ